MKVGLGPVVGAGICACVFVLSLVFNHFKATEPSVWIYNNAKAEAIHVVVDKEHHYLWANDRNRTELALSRVAENFWTSERLAPPVFLHADTLLPALSVVNQVMTVGHVKMARVGHYKTHPLPPVEPPKPLDVEVLVVQRGAPVQLEHMLKFYSPQTIVLDASLSSERRALYAKVAHQLGISLHDIKQDGAFQMKNP